jgi:hypothetical protein
MRRATDASSKRTDQSGTARGSACLRRLPAQKERAYHAYAARILGEIAAAGGGGNPENYFSEAIEIASRFGMRPLLAQCDLGLGAWHRQLGDHARARARLTTAVSALRSLRMPVWLDQAEAELKKVG